MKIIIEKEKIVCSVIWTLRILRISEYDFFRLKKLCVEITMKMARKCLFVFVCCHLKLLALYLLMTIYFIWNGPCNTIF